MGMFDTINVHASICLPGYPDSAARDDFQSKDIDCKMDVYDITEDGRLVHNYREWEPNPEATGLAGCIREKAGSQKRIDLNHHGLLRFYTSIGEGPDYQWYEYNAKFTDGKLVSIERVDTK